VLDRLHNLFVIAERVLLVVVCHSSQGNVVVPALANTPQSPLFFDFLTLWLSRGGGRKTKIAREMRITQPIAVTGCSNGRGFFGPFFFVAFCNALIVTMPDISFFHSQRLGKDVIMVMFNDEFSLTPFPRKI
jgi:hypothetical protein